MDVYDVHLMGELPTPGDDAHTLPHHQRGQFDPKRMEAMAKLHKEQQRKDIQIIQSKPIRWRNGET